MVTFSKVLNMPAPPRRDNCTKIQNKKLLPVVKQCANDSMVNNAMKVKEVNADGEWHMAGARLFVSHNCVVTAISLEAKKRLDVEILSDKCNNA